MNLLDLLLIPSQYDPKWYVDDVEDIRTHVRTHIEIYCWIDSAGWIFVFVELCTDLTRGPGLCLESEHLPEEGLASEASTQTPRFDKQESRLRLSAHTVAMTLKRRVTGLSLEVGRWTLSLSLSLSLVCLNRKQQSKHINQMVVVVKRSRR